MAYALVGTAGTAVKAGAGNTALTPAWGTGENRTANNLLICICIGTGTGGLPTTPAGWSIGGQGNGAQGNATVFYRIATGGDAAPTIAALANVTWAAALYEFSGNLSVSPADQSGSAGGTVSPLVAAAGLVDAAAGELLCYGSSLAYTNARSSTVTPTLNNGATAQDQNNNAISTVGHYDLGYGITTGNTAADQVSTAFTVTQIIAVESVICSFKLAGAAAVKPIQSTIISQAVNRTATWCKRYTGVIVPGDWKDRLTAPKPEIVTV